MAFIGEIIMFAGPALPPGFVLCDGSAMLIDGNEFVYQAIGFNYGGGAQLQLPDLRGRVPVHLAPGAISGFQQQVISGSESVALTFGQIPAHSHPMGCDSSTSNTSITAGSIPASAPTLNPYVSASPNASLSSASVSVVGSGTPHGNMQPYLAINLAICISGGALPTPGTTSGGPFSQFGGMLILSAFGDIAPAGLMRCDGQPLSETVYSGLFSLIGTMYGASSGQFNLPNLISNTICGTGIGTGLATYLLGEQVGESFHTLLPAETPSHTHTLYGVSDAANTFSPSGAFLASAPIYQSGTDGSTMDSSAISVSLPASPHDNRQPFCGITMLIATDDMDPISYIGQIRATFLTVIPNPWLACDGSSLSTASFPALFAIIGYTYGGSGANFNLPDLRGRVPIGAGTSTTGTTYTLGSTGGTEAVVLSTPNMPAHSHIIQAVDGRVTGQVSAPAGNLLCQPGLPIPPTPPNPAYRTSGSQVALGADAIRSYGGGGAHENRMPTTAFTFVIHA